MDQTIARAAGWLLQRLLPASGRRRAAICPANEGRADDATYRLVHVPGATERAYLCGEDVALVRPYLVAHERRREDRLQTSRRRALLLAVHGIDIGPLTIHGVKVGA
ncbi:hypothetical protein [Streptomyces lunaelactis]|uniref:hypothetical protein n=1 Tax=Streptomyces lunaelactis TaxID=1535768 RepID=UPI0015850ED4|nr:hypothetical protein [Streptomyces lunaelactis]NUK22821.1 hypothetical protein [Streptomyces lunaelactis]